MRRPKSAPDKRRRLTQREESAVALIALRMVVAEREWKPGDPPVVRMLDLMFRALEYQIAAKAFGAWLTRLGIQTLRKGGRKLVVVPVNLDEAESVLRKLTGAGHTLATAVKAPILEQACKFMNQDPHEEDAVKGRKILADLDEIDRILEDSGQESHPGSQIPAPTAQQIAVSPEVEKQAIGLTRSILFPNARPPVARKPVNDWLGDPEED